MLFLKSYLELQKSNFHEIFVSPYLNASTGPSDEAQKVFHRLLFHGEEVLQRFAEKLPKHAGL